MAVARRNSSKRDISFIAYRPRGSTRCSTLEHRLHEGQEVISVFVQTAFRQAEMECPFPDSRRGLARCQILQPVLEHDEHATADLLGESRLPDRLTHPAAEASKLFFR